MRININDEESRRQAAIRNGNATFEVIMELLQDMASTEGLLAISAGLTDSARNHACGRADMIHDVIHSLQPEADARDQLN